MGEVLERLLFYDGFIKQPYFVQRPPAGIFMKAAAGQDQSS